MYQYVIKLSQVSRLSILARRVKGRYSDFVICSARSFTCAH